MTEDTPAEIAEVLFDQGIINEEQRDRAGEATRAMGIGAVIKIANINTYRFSAPGHRRNYKTREQANTMRHVAVRIAIILYGQVEHEGTIEAVLQTALAGASLCNREGRM